MSFGQTWVLVRVDVRGSVGKLAPSRLSQHHGAMKWVILGAGGVGAAIGARLFMAGKDVELVARGAHGETLRQNGLHFREPDRQKLLRIPVTDVIAVESDDVVILAVKSQDTRAALSLVPAGIHVVCAQNGVTNEAIVAEKHLAYGMLVWLMAVHLKPGEVSLHWQGCPGVLDVGAINGTTQFAETITDGLNDAGFDSVARPDIMRWKRAKLISNLPGAMQAAGTEFDASLAQQAIDEGRCVFSASSLSVTPSDEFRLRCSTVGHAQVGSVDRPGGSLWQSVHRGSTSEIDALNGEVVRLGKKFGVPTPANQLLVAALR